MEVYEDFVKEIPEFQSYDVCGREHYEVGISPLGNIGIWLNELTKNDNSNNESLIKRICCFLNYLYTNHSKYNRDIKNDFEVYFFWALEYPTINKIKNYLRLEIIDDGRKYLKIIDGENYRPF